ncbi:hypothetical protein FP74_gp025 [Bacillus phage CAM003]|uniref:Uncharacterized protein n=4 Tax=Bastillevirus TaxID=1918010 RepID=A0A024B002_9CAUD|nr:hypothetical protein FP73_gp023 [Bacillus phage Hoody T]YP_009035547.1 hypothetical protein FP76_gp026 [Bacillus phage Evoli]YP_009036928.1 hypothetical protein FP74_gp025 [Bacillus phage CAM003]ASU00874.1 hypothetical protein ANTHONY_27 [Bacillus phage Anthony]AHZ09462.1 hypothetical protein [Bacillus phage CAM003]AHZ09750.1 hypothetical protein [Bacillus phage Evoli]AHZ10335.1 hypothetical protein [Bacillus phage Hoody T]
MPPRFKEVAECTYKEMTNDRLELCSFLSLRRMFKRYLDGQVERWELVTSITMHCKVYNKDYLEIAAIL